MPKALLTDIPALPGMETWVNVRTLGAKGDGTTDDTKAIQAAIDQYENIYVPQGWYRITETLKMRPGTRLIGLHPFATQFRLDESSPALQRLRPPKALLESSEGGADVLNGIGINTGAYNYRAVGVKWMAGEGSYMNDIKFVGGHGGMSKPRPGEPAREWRPPRRAHQLAGEPRGRTGHGPGLGQTSTGACGLRTGAAAPSRTSGPPAPTPPTAST